MTTQRSSKRMTARARCAPVTALVVITMLCSCSLAFAWDGPTIWDIGEIGKRRATLGNPLTFDLGEVSVDKAVFPLTATGLPEGAVLTDYGNGAANFSWTPKPGQEGVYMVTFARDGFGQTEEVMVVVGGLPLSHGFYRLGYGDGVSVNTAQDHVTHAGSTPKLDLNANGGGPGFLIPIVAAADGRIRDIEDGNTACCTGCAECNNFIWIEHANGEWTKYSHPVNNSVTGTFGWTIGDCVQAGDTLGYEGDVGATTGSGNSQRVQNFCLADGNPPDTTKRCFYHVHFEVRQSSQSSDLRVPLFCEVSGNHVLYKGDDYNAGSGCGTGCPNGYVLSGQTWNGDSIAVFTADDDIQASNITISGTASAAFFAGDHITLKPGFIVRKNSYFHAMIKPCEGGTTGCPF